jgi:hypothetical protein
MKQNEYNAAEAVEIGTAAELILGEKIPLLFMDSSGGLPEDWLYQED